MSETGKRAKRGKPEETRGNEGKWRETTGNEGKRGETRANGAIIFVYYFLALSFEQLNYKPI